jgi:ABC-type glycerol-3-phosphate transport system permease component
MGQSPGGETMLVQGVNYVMAACTLMVIFPLLLFFTGQKYFVENIVISGIKG